MSIHCKPRLNCILVYVGPVLLLGGCLFERSNPVYCDLQGQDCSPGSYCDVATRTCRAVEPDMAVPQPDLSTPSAPPDMLTCWTVAGGKSAGEDCSLDSDCASRVCDATKCLDYTKALYVDNQDGACTGDHSGCPNDPLCDIEAAATRYWYDPQLGIERDAIVVAGSDQPYNGLRFGNRLRWSHRLLLIGPGRDASPPALMTSDWGSNHLPTAMNVFTALDDGTQDVVVRGLSLQGMDCSSYQTNIITMHLDQVRLQPTCPSCFGVTSTNCVTTLSNSIVGPGTGRPVVASGGTIDIVNTLFTGLAATETIALTDGAVGRVAFSTIVNIGDNVDAGVTATRIFDCDTGGSGSASIQNTIVGGPRNFGASGALGACTFQQVVSASLGAPSGVVVATPDFVDPIADFHLKDTPNNHACCIDKAQLSGGAITPSTDIDGTHRPQGGGSDVGAYEFKP